VRNARQVVGQSQPLLTEAGLAQHHRVTLDGLSPDTLYAYRVKGESEWSEWLQFRTAHSHFSPYTALYLGDTQNYIQSLGSRTMRAAFSAAPDAKVMIHAGDLIDRSGPYDQLWGEWFNAGSWILSSVNQLVVTGNHEYREAAGVAPQLLEHWPAHFALPSNGPENLQASVYTVDYQGVRYIVLDSMAAMHSNLAAQQQAQWLEGLLVNNPNHWTLVSYHHPLMSGSSGKVNAVIAQHWQPLFERYGVDLVLQGHDHLYARWHSAQEPPVYTISVTGAKLNRVNPRASAQMQRVGEDAQWYQIIRFEAERLRYEAWTVTGELYDAFELVRGNDGKTRIEENASVLSAERLCSKPNEADTAPTSNPGEYPRPVRCWLVTELE
jgi:3',5'-cyclic AMP phosphodiesterase CpdA